MGELVKMNAPDSASAVSWAGKEIQVVKGFIRVEAEAVEHMIAHGFSVFTGKKPADDKNPDGNPDDKNPDGTPKVPE